MKSYLRILLVDWIYEQYYLIYNQSAGLQGLSDEQHVKGSAYSFYQNYVYGNTVKINKKILLIENYACYNTAKNKLN